MHRKFGVKCNGSPELCVRQLLKPWIRLQSELLVWMHEHEYDSIRQMQGSMSRRSVARPSAFERANCMKVLSSYAMR